MLGRFLVSSGKLPQNAVHAAHSDAVSRGVPLADVLVERKLLTPTDLYRALQQNLGRNLLDPFSWTGGAWTISRDVPPIASVLRVRVPQLLVTGILKVSPQETADVAAARAEGKYLAVTSEPLFELEGLRLGKDHQKLVDAARRGTSFEEIRNSSGIDGEDLNRIVHTLLLLGVVTITDRPVRESPKFELVNPFAAKTAEVPAPAPAVSAEPVPARARGVEAASAEEVIAAYLACRRNDAYEMLGAVETDGMVPIIKSFLWMTEKFLPSKFDERAADGLREKAQEVFLAAARAYAELADPARREALIRRRQKLRELARQESQATPAAMIDPEALCDTGRKLAAAGKLREALSSFEMAAECDAQNGTYAAEAAWIRYRLNVTPAASALKFVKNAMRIDPESGVAHLYAGQLQAVLGKRVEAEAYLSRAAELMRGDPRAVQALKALR